MNASDFKAQCLAILDEVARTGEPVLILKRGVPVAEVHGAMGREDGWPQQTLKGTVEFLGDVLGPVLPPEDWEALGGRSK
ncbi:MAG: type II toxin-antitoxin system prevent-host-death family antitoxin [Polyangia bacterium]|nr:type II toxin-antitoxin system prevent-host-death family antitoxin [Polyangia bacterium]